MEDLLPMHANHYPACPELGEKTASTALDLLNGRLQLTQSASSATRNPVPMFNWEQIKRWGGTVSGLPGNTVFVNRVPTFWEQYRIYVIGFGIFVVAQSFLIAALLISRRKRRRAERSLQESEENLAITLHSIGDAVIATDRSGRVTRMNATAERLSGWTLVDALGRPLAELFRIINATTREPVTDPVQLVMAQGQVVGLANHTVLLAKDGHEYHIADSAAPIRNDATEIIGVVLVFSDVSEKLKAQEALDKFFDQSIDLHLIAGLDGTIHRVNKGWETVLGYAKSEIEGSNFLALVHPDDKADTISEMGKLAQGVVTFHFENRYRHSSGEFRLLTWSASVSLADQQIYAIATDITQKKQDEDRLKSLSQRLLLATSSAKLGIWDWNVRDNTLVWDEQMFALYGVSPEAHPNSLDAWTNRLHPQDKDRAIAECNLALSGERDFDTVFRVVHPQGSVRHVKASGLVIRSPDGQVERMIGINYDITERRSAEAKLELAANVFRHAREGIIITDASGTRSGSANLNR